MKKIFQVLNQLVREGVIAGYALGGAVGTMFYTEAFSTKDVDVFVFPETVGSGIIHFNSLYNRLQELGYRESRGQFLIMEGIPVDFVVPDDLVEEGMRHARRMKYEGVTVNVLSPEYLAAIALRVRRPQDAQKVRLLRESGQLDERKLAAIRRRHGVKP